VAGYMRGDGHSVGAVPCRHLASTPPTGLHACSQGNPQRLLPEPLHPPRATPTK
jgi:hypothetical protein